MSDIDKAPFASVAIIWVLAWYVAVYLLDIEQVRQLTREDGLVEYVGAAFFLAASVMFFVLFLRSRSDVKIGLIPTKGNIFFLLLSLAFLFVCGEEISWGQRIFGFSTPESLRELNAQREFNFHNLQAFHGLTESGEKKSFFALLLNMDRLFSIFWVTYCFLMPVTYRYINFIRVLLDRLQMPIVPIYLGSIFVLNYAIPKVLESVLDSEFHSRIVEIKESNIAFLFFVLALWFICASNGEKARQVRSA